jgi:cob(I)alamin adenosyltransferase
MIESIQEDLLVVGAELSCETPTETSRPLEDDRIMRIERWIEELQHEVTLQRRFICPGGNPSSAAIDLARTIARRAERRVVEMSEAGMPVRAQVHAYLNRLSDFLFTLARYAGEKGWEESARVWKRAKASEMNHKVLPEVLQSHPRDRNQ